MGGRSCFKQNFKKKNQKYWTKWNRKMGGRSCFITSGAFGHGLRYTGSVNDLSRAKHWSQWSKLQGFGRFF